MKAEDIKKSDVKHRILMSMFVFCIIATFSFMLYINEFNGLENNYIKEKLTGIEDTETPKAKTKELTGKITSVRNTEKDEVTIPVPVFEKKSIQLTEIKDAENFDEFKTAVKKQLEAII